ncbi:MAG: DUF559 domain-containing protein [Chloroflexota bacterium]
MPRDPWGRRRRPRRPSVPTPAERRRRAHFRAQHALAGCIAEFCTLPRCLIIEMDGGQHPEQEDYDTRRPSAPLRVERCPAPGLEIAP